VLDAAIQKPGKELGYKPGAEKSDLLVLPVLPLAYLRGKNSGPNPANSGGCGSSPAGASGGRVNTTEGEADEQRSARCLPHLPGSLAPTHHGVVLMLAAILHKDLAVQRGRAELVDSVLLGDCVQNGLQGQERLSVT